MANVPQDVEKMSFVINIHDALKRMQTFGQVNDAYVRIYDKDTGKELIRYELGKDFSVETSVLTAQLYRYKGEWRFNAVGQGYKKGLDSFVREYGLDVAEPENPNMYVQMHLPSNYRYKKKKTNLEGVCPQLM